MIEAVKEAIWLKGIVSELGVVYESIKVHCDSQSAINLVKYQVFHEHSKHIDVRHYFVRNMVNKGDIKVAKVST